MDYAFGHNKQFARLYSARRFHFDIHLHLTFQNVEKIIRVVVFVEWIRTHELYNHDLVFVVVSDNMRIPMR